MKLTKAFTLVELLVVMAIISFLSVGAFAGLSFGLRQARDVQKKKIVDLAHTAMQAYYSDYSSYPKCNGSEITSNMPTGWAYCPNAFPFNGNGGFLITNGGSDSIKGVKDYLEGEWPKDNSNANPGQTDGYLRYYVNSGTGPKLKFAVCITVENTTAASNLKRRNTTIKDCYCAGTEYSDVACAGMLSRSE